MIKTKAWPVRAMYLLVALALVLSLVMIAAPSQVSADPGLTKWKKQSSPSYDGWVVAPNSNVTHLAPAAGGATVYCVGFGHDDNDPANPIVPVLWKSTDSLASWKTLTSKIEKEIDDRGLAPLAQFIKVSCDPMNPDFLAVALELTDGMLRVFVSDNGGATFKDTGDLEDGTAELTEIHTLTVSMEVDDEHNIALSGIGEKPAMTTRGLVFRYETGLGAGWEDATKYLGWDDYGAFTSVVAPTVKFASSFSVDGTVLVTTATAYNGVLGDIYLQTGTWGHNEGWNEEVTFAPAVIIVEDQFIAPLKAAVAGINLPRDYAGRYASKRYSWVNVNYLDFDTGLPTGIIYRVIDDAADPILQQVKDTPWLTAVSYSGFIDEGKAMASLMGDGTGAPTECCEGVQVYRNDSIVDMDICCKSWKPACKPPTGRVAVAAFWITATKAYALSLNDSLGYDESAWSFSLDDGDTWNQLSLIDTNIDWFSDIAKSPNCNKTMLVSINEWCEGCGCDSVWLNAIELAEAPEYNGVWIRTWCGLLEWNEGLLRLAPEEVNGDTVYLVDRWTDTVYWGTMEGMACWEEGHSTIPEIEDLAVKDEATIYGLDWSGDVAMSDDHGATATWDDPIDSKVDEGHTIAVLGDNILVGGGAGKVSHSGDGGETYTELDKKSPDEGNVHIAFDSYFPDNNTIYSADSAGGIYRWVIGESEDWKDLNALPLGYYGIVLDRADGNPMTDAQHGGVLYAAYADGVARCLTPAETPCCDTNVWDYLEAYLDVSVGFMAEPSSLRICGCLTADSNSQLWAIDWEPYDYDAGEGRVWAWEDCFAKHAPTLLAPADGAMVAADPCICTNDNVVLKWERLCNACEYEVFIAKDPDCSTEIVIDDIVAPPSGDNPSYVLVEGDLNCATTYYWRVRVVEAETGQEVTSFKSVIWNFTVAAGPQAGVFLTAPDDGTTNVPVSGISFTWTTVQGADSYDIVISANADMSSPVESKAGTTATAYTLTATLDNNAPYYWQVTAKKAGQALDTSNVSTFTTAPVPPTPPPPPPEPTTPAWVWVVIGIGAVLVIVVIVLIFRTRRV